VISNIAVLDVINNPAPVITPASATICNGAAQVFTANNFTGVTYQWYRNSVLIPGATAQTYSATLAGQYKVIETANGCYKTKSAQLAVTSCREEGEGIIANKQSNISISPHQHIAKSFFRPVEYLCSIRKRRQCRNSGFGYGR